MSKKKKDWKTEKERMLRLDQDERRKEYRRQDFVPLEKIPSWRQENRFNEEEEEPELTGEGGGLSDKVSLYKGDITVLEVDAIVNAANSSLLGGGGVDGCIHKAAGSCLYDECHSLSGCETGNAKITCGYDLPARYVIHTVGPVARNQVGTTENNDLKSCYWNSLQLVKEHSLKTVAFPCISTGIYGFPNDPAADIALSTVKRWIKDNPDKITRVIFCVFLETDFVIYKRKMSLLFQDNDVDVAETELKEDDTPPSPKSAAKEESDDGNRDKEESGDEDEGANDAGGNRDVEMASQNPDENSGSEEPTEEKDEGGNESQGKDKDKGLEKNEKDEAKSDGGDKDDGGDKEAGQPAPSKMADDNAAAASTVEMEDVSEMSDAGASQGDEMRDPVESPERPDVVPTASSQPKDTEEKKE
ncbi:ADP-ribose glycohydrolase MACROD2 isoform X2 [Takifugu rubripes]|uniref:ADP-ribose glycohydrolase MACROD2 isoform X2 n=1 Tax=Takifugu rubripes TaxID=31033 RepID=UPI0011458ED8|nr:ADP-ribose glycohydrolase MACROD2 isoform X2 [Takifugu rubripes]